MTAPILCRLCACPAVAGALFGLCQACLDKQGAALAATASEPCPRCGASPLRLDESGFCSDCGMKPKPKAARSERPPERESVEVDADLAMASDIGSRHHENQDAGAASRSGPWALMVVCDGVSSAQDSHLASRVAVNAWEMSARGALDAGKTPQEAMVEGLEQAQLAVLALPYDRAASRLDEPMATIVAAISTPGLALLGWAGDSRAYGIGPGSKPRLLTRDDSWMQSALEEGMAQAEADADSRAHAITQCLGSREEDPDFNLAQAELSEGEGLLLCSDGLWNYFPRAADLAGIAPAGAAPSAEQRCLAWIERANAAGGRDNITAAFWRP